MYMKDLVQFQILLCSVDFKIVVILGNSGLNITQP